MKIALFVPTLDGGGAEHQMLLLASALSGRGYDIDFIVSIRHGPFLSQLPSGINLVVLQYSGLLTLIIDLARYFHKARPLVMISAMPPANGYSIWARFISGSTTQIIVTEHNVRSEVLELNDSFMGKKILSKKYLKFQLIRHSYRFADAIVGVSKGVATRLRKLPGVQRHQVHSIYNGVDLSFIATKSATLVGDPWLDNKKLPVILGAGRLEKVKDFFTLIRSFNLVRNIRPARLIILGEGSERPQLEYLITELGLADIVRLPGFDINPYAYMARASVFALSSRHEGFSIVLIEALACGTPVVATDCPTGPREILNGGRYGRLVPVGDAEALARAIIETLDNPPPPEFLKERGQRFSIDASTDAYLRLIRPTQNKHVFSHTEV